MFVCFCNCAWYGGNRKKNGFWRLFFSVFPKIAPPLPFSSVWEKHCNTIGGKPWKWKWFELILRRLTNNNNKKNVFDFFFADIRWSSNEINQRLSIKKWSEKRFFFLGIHFLDKDRSIFVSGRYFQKNKFHLKFNQKYHFIPKISTDQINSRNQKWPTTTTRQPSENKNLVIVCMSVCVCVLCFYCAQNKMVSRSDCHRHRCRRGYLFMNEDDDS